MLTKQERMKLDQVFTALQQFREREWACAAEGDFWKGDVVFIQRGPLLLMGRYRYVGMFVITPFHGRVKDIDIDDPQTLQKVKVVPDEPGTEVIRIYDEDPGPWWEFLRRELEGMEVWMKNVREATNRKMERDKALDRAAAAVRNVLRFAEHVG